VRVHSTHERKIKRGVIPVEGRVCWDLVFCCLTSWGVSIHLTIQQASTILS